MCFLVCVILLLKILDFARDYRGVWEEQKII